MVKDAHHNNGDRRRLRLSDRQPCLGAKSKHQGRANRLPKGQRCWRYAGTAPEFHGVFRAGQSLTVTSTGDSHYGDPAGDVIKTEERSVSVSLAHSPVFETHGTRADTFVVRQTGDYMFSINPAASWGYPQVFIVCTS